MKYAIFLLLVCFVCSTVSQAQVETPEEALETIIELYQSRDFDTLIQERYAELHKAKSQEQIDSLINKFIQTFEDDNKLKQVIHIYEQASLVTPVFQTNPLPQESETETMVVYELDESKL